MTDMLVQEDACLRLLISKLSLSVYISLKSELSINFPTVPRLEGSLVYNKLVLSFLKLLTRLEHTLHQAQGVPDNSITQKKIDSQKHHHSDKNPVSLKRSLKKFAQSNKPRIL